MSEAKAIKLTWKDASEIISKQVSDILGRKVICVAHWNDYCYWAVSIVGERIPLSDLIKIFETVNADDSQRNDSMPESTVKEISAREIGMDVAALLLERHFGYEWEAELIEEKHLWLLGEKDGNPDED